MGRVTSKGDIRVKQVAVTPKPQVRIRKFAPVHCTTRNNEGIRITVDPSQVGAAFEIWVVVEESDRGRAGLCVHAPPGVTVDYAKPVVVDSSPKPL